MTGERETSESGCENNRLYTNKDVKKYRGIIVDRRYNSTGRIIGVVEVDPRTASKREFFEAEIYFALMVFYKSTCLLLKSIKLL